MGASQRNLDGPRVVGGPRVSVVVPCHNYGRYLKECVESVLTQEGVDLDVLIVDDASSDDSWEMAEDLAKTDSRVTITRNDVNLGMVATINQAMWQVDGEYLVKLDADDLLTPGSLARSSEFLQSHPRTSFVYGTPIFFRDAPTPARTTVTGYQVWSGQDWLAIRCRSATNCIGQPEVVIRRSALHAAGRYSIDLPHTSDFEMWLRLAALGDVGWIRGADQGWMRVHSGSMQQTVHRGHVTDLLGRRNAFATFFAQAGRDLPDSVRLHRQARLRLAQEALGLACSAYNRGIADKEPVEEYVAFALDVAPDASRTSTWRELRLRQHPRTGLDRLRPEPFVGTAHRRVAKAMAERRWRRSGV